ncbi:hypothetical protein CFC21_055111 [Triticum aestivum]|uniref:Uncharacterized protein n=2 Tax=Triticum aestivum TaxID=4565 RepID=A0A9R1K9P5_WHEAT|nr:hypothetical protein CFC21_055111 [Triticum aestivum]
MAESLLLPLVRGVAGKAADALVEAMTRMCGLNDDRRTLERHLLAVVCKLNNAEERSETNIYVKSWMKELKSVAYEADDVLDDFQYEALRRQSKISKSTTRKVLSYVTPHSPLLFRFEMSKKLKNILEKINTLVEEMNKFGLENSEHRDEQRHPWRQTHSKVDDSTKIFGRDDDKEVVVKLLLDQQDQQKVQVFPIFGMGGLGKTTLAKMVYNDQEVHRHFKLKMWHCVSENFDVIALVKSIIELAANGSCYHPGSIELLQKQLEQVIGRTRFMLVLDDVWNEDENKWEDILKPLLCSVGGPGSVIVVTTRSQKVGSIMQTLQPYKLACLSEQDSWELFAQKAYSNGLEKEKAELVSIGRRIVNKCRGLPLALKTMGGLLGSYQQVQEWKAVEESNSTDNVRGKDEIISILKLSYRHLSSEIKQCFAFLAVFPKDYKMDKDTLIQLWMANGFIQEKGTIDLKTRGEFIFNELVWRSFLEDKQEQTHNDGTRSYVTINCKMHDLMHDLAKDFTDECASIEELAQQRALLQDVYHLQTSDAELEQISGLCKGRTYLRTLLASSESYMDFNYNNYNFLSKSHKDIKELQQVLSSLRALHCSPTAAVICKAINPKHLRYLDLFGSDIVRLPDSICMLYNLQTLRLINCQELQQLPENMARLIKLIHLYLSGCYSLKSMSPNFGLLKNLHILTTFVVGTGYGLGIEQLKGLQHLSNRLELVNLSNIKSGENAKEANLCQKENLSELLFSWDQQIDDEPTDVEEMLQGLEPNSNIQKLEIHGYGGLEISQWMRNPQMFNCLRELKFFDCPKCKSIPVVWLSVSLEILLLEKMDSLITLLCNNLDVESGFISPLQIFPWLKRMMLIDLPRLQIWSENSVGMPSDSLVTFPMLEELKIENCPEFASISTTLTVSFLGIKGAQGPLEKLKCLTLKGPNRLVTSFRLSISQLMLWKCFHFMEELTIDGCSDLVCWPNEQLRLFDRLRVLCIRYCDKLDGWSHQKGTLPLSLEKLDISDCRSLAKLPSKLGNLAKLRSLNVSGCSGLKALSDGMDGLTSLGELKITESDMKGFPHGLLERLPALERLSILFCPELARRCREGGEYFHLVSSVPHKMIDLCSGVLKASSTAVRGATWRGQPLSSSAGCGGGRKEAMMEGRFRRVHPGLGQLLFSSPERTPRRGRDGARFACADGDERWWRRSRED